MAEPRDRTTVFIDRWTARDSVWLLALLALAIAYTWQFGNLRAHPAEDAAILMRYAQHLAWGHGIVWNIGDRPVEGATDFLFMATIAGLIKMGFGVEAAVRTLTLAAWFGIMILVFMANRLLYAVPAWLAAFCSAFVITGPALNYIEAQFGTPVFGFWAGLTWFLAIVAARRGGWADAFAFAVSSLLLGLVRPEGVFLASFMVVSIAILSSRRPTSVLVAFASVLGIVGGAYFLWRWSYFGYPLPNPFYRKSHRSLEWAALAMPLRNVLILLNVLLLAFIAGFTRPSSRREATALAVPVLGFTLIWVLLSNEMNYRMRFQFAVVPLVLISGPALVYDFWKQFSLASRTPQLRRASPALAAIVLTLLLAGQAFVYRRSRPTTADGRYEVAVRLAALADRGYLMATSEAGLLPLYSRWRSLDTWGLNDVEIAHARGLTPEYLDRLRPEVIMFHAYFGPAYQPEQPPTDAWDRMCLVLRDYAVKHDYHLAALRGEASKEFHYYYVRPDFAAAREVEQMVGTEPYWSWLGGKALPNLAPAEEPPVMLERGASQR